MSVPWDATYEELLGQALPRIAEQGSLTPDVGLKAVGLDSLAMVEVLIQLEGAYGISIPDDDLAPGVFDTPASLWELVVAVRERQTAVG
ncbi:phosphopantetheine-binding protein [Streptomyces sp. Je 1-332]|uniref:phosphopantetheine-binding protein n=1 Tax=Streptomyces sp. Je 1-332 TaxID=3231270 RepID=UPI00345B3F4D